MFWKKKLTEDFVELTFGKIYFKEITHGMLNKITRKSTIVGRTLNVSLFLELFEYALLDLSKRKIRNLSLNEGNKVRSKIKEILLRHGIVEPEKVIDVKSDDANIFSQKDIQWFEKAKQQGLKGMAGQ